MTEPEESACSAIGIELSFSETVFLKSLETVKPSQMTNAVIFELFCYVQKQKKLTWKDVRDVFAIIYNQDLTSMQPGVLRNSVARVKAQRANIIKTKIDDRGHLIQDFFGKQWQLPVTLPPRSKKRQLERDQSSDTDTNTLPLKVPKMQAFMTEILNETIEKLARETTALGIQISDLAQENGCLLNENKKLSSQLHVMKQRLRLYNPKKVNQALKRKRRSIDYWKQKCRALAKSSNKAIMLQKALCDVKRTLSLMKKSKKKQSERYKEGIKKRKIVTTIVIEKASSDFISQLSEKQQKLKQAQEEIRSLEVDLDTNNCL